MLAKGRAKDSDEEIEELGRELKTDGVFLYLIDQRSMVFYRIGSGVEMHG